MDWKPRKKRLFVFSVPRRQKIKGSILYTPRQNAGQYTEVKEIWVIAAGPECQGYYEDGWNPWKPGQKCYITDGFELEPVNLDLWNEYKDRPEFQELRTFVDEVEGEVHTEIVAEGSILAMEG